MFTLVNDLLVCSMLTEHRFAYFSGTVKAAMTKKVDFFNSYQYHFVVPVDLYRCAVMHMSDCSDISIYVKY